MADYYIDAGMDVIAVVDPLVSQIPLAKLAENTRVTCLGTMGMWTYIEAEEKASIDNLQKTYKLDIVLLKMHCYHILFQLHKRV